MRLSPPARRHLQAADIGQLSLPFQIGAEPAPSSPSIECAHDVPIFQLRRSSDMNSGPQELCAQELYKTKCGERNGKRKPPNRASVPSDAKLLLSRKEASEMLSISIRGVDYLIADGRLPTRRIANRVLISTEAIRKFAQSDHPKRLAG
jgi:hypothetical protein